MLGLTQLSRALDTQRHAQVIDGCLRSAGPVPLSLRLQFESPGSLHAGALALALKRMVEMSYRVTEPIEHAARALIDLQLDDGSFTREHSPAVDVASLAGLSGFLDLAERAVESRSAGPVLVQLLERARDAFERGVSLIRTAAAISDHGLVSDEVTTAYVLLTSVRDARLRGAIDPGWLLEALHDCGARHHRQAGPMLLHAERLMAALERSGAPAAAPSAA